MQTMTSIRVSLACLFCLLCGARPLTAQAATISIAPSYVQSFDAAQNPLGNLENDGATTPLGGYLQYEFRLTLDNPAADEDFWIAVFDIRLAPGLENASGWLDPGVAQANGYYPDAPSLAMYDSNFTAQLADLQQSYIDRSELMDLEAYRARSLGHRILESFARLLGPLL